MKKWIYSAIIYLAIVVGVFVAFDSASNSLDKASSEENDSHNEPTSGHGESHSEDSHGHEEETSMESEIVVTVKEEEEGHLLLTLADTKGNPVTDLAISHEKLLHLIIVDDHLEQYVHLHPEEVGRGQFKVSHSLKTGNYKAFVDIAPKGFNYEVEPVTFTIGSPTIDDHGHASLQVDEELSKVVDGNKVTLEMTELVVGQPVTLTFDVKGGDIEPYLGAMGHVVILDEEAEEYVHVHPTDEEKTIFETQFSRPGIYKIWAEFQQDGKVTAYPFVIEVK